MISYGKTKFQGVFRGSQFAFRLLLFPFRFSLFASTSAANTEKRTPNTEKTPQLSISALISSSVARLKSPLKVYFSVEAASA